MVGQEVRGCKGTEVRRRRKTVVGAGIDYVVVEEQHAGQPTVLLPDKSHNEWILHLVVAVMGYDNWNSLPASSWLIYGSRKLGIFVKNTKKFWVLGSREKN